MTLLTLQATACIIVYGQLPVFFLSRLIMGIERFNNMDGFQLVAMHDHQMLHERRVFLGLTQQAVANRAGVPLQSYQQFESGKRKIRRASFQIAAQVLEALEMDISKFHHGDYVLGEPVEFRNGGVVFKATGKPIDEEPICEHGERTKLRF